MNGNLPTRVLFEFGKDIAALVRMVMDSNVGINSKTKPPRNTLSDSDIYRTLSVRATNDGDLVMDIVLNDYIQYIESGRRKGESGRRKGESGRRKGESGRRKGAKFPPVEPIVRWCKEKGIPSDNSTIFLIRRAIARDGIAPRPIMAKVFDELDRAWDNEWSDRLFDIIMETINKFFNGN
jgi:hypothetical protein